MYSLLERADIEDITHKTGNFKRFTVLVKMLTAALAQQSDSVFIDLLTFADLEMLKQRRAASRASKTDSGASPGRSTLSPGASSSASVRNSNKRYIILTYAAEFDRVHYPLPLAFQEDPPPDCFRRTIRRLRGEIYQLRKLADQAVQQQKSPEKKSANDLDSDFNASLVPKLQRENDTLQDTIKRLKHDLSESQATAREMQQRAEEAEVGRRKAESTLERLRTASRSEVRRLRKEIGNLQDNVAAANKYAKEAEQQAEERAAENIDILKETNNNLRQRVRDLTKQLAVHGIRPKATNTTTKPTNSPGAKSSPATKNSPRYRSNMARNVYGAGAKKSPRTNSNQKPQNAQRAQQNAPRRTRSLGTTGRPGANNRGPSPARSNASGRSSSKVGAAYNTSTTRQHSARGKGSSRTPSPVIDPSRVKRKYPRPWASGDASPRSAASGGSRGASAGAQSDTDASVGSRGSQKSKGSAHKPSNKSRSGRGFNPTAYVRERKSRLQKSKESNQKRGASPSSVGSRHSRGSSKSSGSYFGADKRQHNSRPPTRKQSREREPESDSEGPVKEVSILNQTSHSKSDKHGRPYSGQSDSDGSVAQLELESGDHSMKAMTKPPMTGPPDLHREAWTRTASNSAQKDTHASYAHQKHEQYAADEFASTTVAPSNVTAPPGMNWDLGASSYSQRPYGFDNKMNSSWDMGNDKGTDSTAEELTDIDKRLQALQQFLKAAKTNSSEVANS